MSHDDESPIDPKPESEGEELLIDDVSAEMGELTTKEDAHSSTIILIGVVLALSLSHSVYSTVSIADKLHDHTIPLVQCPVSYELDSPVILPVIRDTIPKSKDMWVRGFIRKFVVHQFPRNSADAESFLKYVVNRSSGSVQRTYLKRLNHLEAFKQLTDQGYLYEFYPNDSQQIRIRSKGLTSGTWIVEIDGWLKHKVQGRDYQSSPTLRYKIESGDVTLENPEGLYVIEANVDKYQDLTTGEKE